MTGLGSVLQAREPVHTHASLWSEEGWRLTCWPTITQTAQHPSELSNLQADTTADGSRQDVTPSEVHTPSTKHRKMLGVPSTGMSAGADDAEPADPSSLSCDIKAMTMVLMSLSSLYTSDGQ